MSLMMCFKDKGDGRYFKSSDDVIDLVDECTDDAGTYSSGFPDRVF